MNELPTNNNKNYGTEQREVLVDKLNGALATLRKEQDEVHRKKELAAERLRLAKEERMAMEKTVNSMKEALNRLTATFKHGNSGAGDSSSTNHEKEIERLQTDIDRLTKEVKFQHAELVSKKEKLQQLKSLIDDEDGKRNNYLRTARDSVRMRREKITLKQNSVKNNNSSSAGTASLESLLKEKQGDYDTFSQINRIIEKKTSELVAKTESFKQESEALKRVLIGYMKYLDQGDYFFIESKQ